MKVIKENEWTKTICELLMERNLGENIYIDVPNVFEI